MSNYLTSPGIAAPGRLPYPRPYPLTSVASQRVRTSGQSRTLAAVRTKSGSTSVALQAPSKLPASGLSI